MEDEVDTAPARSRSHCIGIASASFLPQVTSASPANAHVAAHLIPTQTDIIDTTDWPAELMHATGATISKNRLQVSSRQHHRFFSRISLRSGVWESQFASWTSHPVSTSSSLPASPFHSRPRLPPQPRAIPTRQTPNVPLVPGSLFLADHGPNFSSDTSTSTLAPTVLAVAVSLIHTFTYPKLWPRSA